VGSPEEPQFVAVGEEEAWQGRRLTITRRRYRGPDGDEFEREFTHHPGAVGIIAVDDQDRVTLVRQFRAPMAEWILEMPAGTCDVAGESPARTAERELAEEVGLTAAHWELLAPLPVSPGVTDQITRAYLATGLVHGDTAREGPEERAMTVVVVPLDEVVSMAADGTLIDAPTLAAVALARRALDVRRR
jgi:8-oxo-dGTP pyrophosphatase MutT (NUDIX family)